MRKKKIFDAIGEIDGEYIEEATRIPLEKEARNFKRWIALAACLVLLVGIGLSPLKTFLPFGGKSGIGGSGENHSFMSYAGPVFPLTLDEEDKEISVSRDISYDFSLDNEDSIRTWGARVQDSYSINNTSPQPKSLKGIYPFAGSFNELLYLLPRLTIDGKEVTGRLYAGGYPNQSMEDTANVKLNNWQAYKALLENGDYKNDAFGDYPRISQEVIVYNFEDFKAPEEYKAASQAISFTLDPEKTTVLTYGFEGTEINQDGFRRYSYFVPHTSENKKTSKKLIIVGNDISDYKLQGYKDGACEEGNELEGVSVKITREERDLAGLMEEIIDDFTYQHDNEDFKQIPKDIFYGTVTQAMVEYKLLSPEFTGRYDFGSLEDLILDTRNLERVFYLEFDLELGSNSKVTLLADMRKKPSHDFAGSGSKKAHIQGYDMVTKLGSNLDFERIDAEVRATENIKIHDNNFGFDLAKGISRVELNPQEEYYYLEIVAIDK